MCEYLLQILNDPVKSVLFLCRGFVSSLRIVFIADSCHDLQLLPVSCTVLPTQLTLLHLEPFWVLCVCVCVCVCMCACLCVCMCVDEINVVY